MVPLFVVPVAAAEPPVLRELPTGAPPLIPLSGVSTNDQGVTVSLESCGAQKSDFTVAIAKSVERPTILIARRTASNLIACDVRSSRIVISWTYAELGLKLGQPFSLANPLMMPPSAAQSAPGLSR